MAHQQVVEHFVVGQQDVRRAFAQRVLAGNDLFCRHFLAGFDFAVADKQADGHLAMQLWIAGDGFGETAGLIGCGAFIG